MFSLYTQMGAVEQSAI